MHTQSPNRIAELLAKRPERLVHLAAYCDVDQSTAYRWQEGITPIPDTQKPRVASFFGVPIAYLMRWDDSVPDPSTPAAA